jgi:hypothetical protein
MLKLGTIDRKKDGFIIKKLETNILKELVNNFIGGLHDDKL